VNTLSLFYIRNVLVLEVAVKKGIQVQSTSTFIFLDLDFKYKVFIFQMYLSTSTSTQKRIYLDFQVHIFKYLPSSDFGS
jgi:hypothetical protein